MTARPRLAILFWFHKAFDLCGERIALLRALNPDTPIYGLYGGDLEQAEEARARFEPLLDDLYVFDEPRTSEWKWLYEDRLLAAWHAARGVHLPWDTVVLAQWDMLLLAPAQQLFAMLEPGELLLSGARPLEEVRGWWGWAKGEDAAKRAEMEAFTAALAAEGYDGPLWCALFIVVCLPRAFMDRYVGVAHHPGFVDYKLPTFARAFGTPFRLEHPYRPWWAADPSTRDAPERDKTLNGVSQGVRLEIIEAELARPDGQRIFHPYREPFALDCLR